MRFAHAPFLFERGEQKMVRHYLKIVIFMLIIGLAMLPAGAAFASSDAPSVHAEHAASAAPAPPASTTPWWIWPLSLFLVTFILGILAVLGGVGGGGLLVPSGGGFFPF